MTLRTIVGALAALAISAAPASAQGPTKAGSETAESGAVKATLTWEAGEFGAANPKIHIDRNGAPVFDTKAPEGCETICYLTPGQNIDIQVSDLNADGEPEVIFSGFSGGAHCCFVMGLYVFNGTGYTKIERDFRSRGYQLKDLDGDGTIEIDTSDVRFEDRFTSHAASAEPTAILSLGKDRKLHDVTRKHPSVIKANAKELLRIIRGKQLKPVGSIVVAGGFVAAYVAEQYSLGKGSVGLKELDRQTKRGYLGSKKAAKAYRKDLLRILKVYGYR